MVLTDIEAELYNQQSGRHWEDDELYSLLFVFRTLPSKLSQSSIAKRFIDYTRSNSNECRGSLRTLRSYRRGSIRITQELQESTLTHERNRLYSQGTNE
uniref:HTH_48 domain-containing protein n=1 Tax=Heterorhabditis bacteriophora TaxID=37862 RepID=A0A1I7WUJ3_HETBA